MPIPRINETIYGGLYGNATRAVGLAFNLARKGFDVSLEVTEDFENALRDGQKPERLNFVTESMRDPVLRRSDLLLISCTGLESFEKVHGRDPYIAHPEKALICCFDNNQKIDFRRLGPCRFATFNNWRQVDLWNRRGTGIPAIPVAYGVDEYEAVEAAIREPGRQLKAIWVGEIRSRLVLEKILRFAKANFECEVAVVTRRIFDYSADHGDYGSFVNPYASFEGDSNSERFYELIQELFGYNAPHNVKFLGTLEGTIHRVLGDYQIGLDFSRGARQRHDNTKIQDYLRSGLWVVTDRGSPSYRFVREMDYGSFLPGNFSSTEAREAVRDSLSKVSREKRLHVSRSMNDRYGWPTRARKIAFLIRTSFRRPRIFRMLGALSTLRSGCAHFGEYFRSKSDSNLQLRGNL